MNGKIWWALAGLALCGWAKADFGPDASGGGAIRTLLDSRSAGDMQSFASAAEQVRQAADAGDARARFVIALVADSPMPPPAAKMTEELRRSYLDGSREEVALAAERRNDALAWFLLALEKNDFKMLKRAADGGSVPALNMWGTVTLSEALEGRNLGTNDVSAVLRTCFGAFKRTADAADANGLYNLGMCYQNGYGCDRNENLAFECFRKASEAGHPEAINNLGGMYRDGVVVRKNAETAAQMFARSAGMGNAYGQLNYALALQRGDGVARDEGEAVALLKASAEQGNREAMSAYGMCFLNGSGVAKNADTAYAWFRRSAAKGFPGAMDNLAECYERGLGVVRDVKEAMVWKIRARAAAGDRNASAWLRKNGHALR